MSAPKVIFIDEAEFGLAAYDADDGLTKQVALRFTARGGTLCDDVEDADYVIINTSKSDWRSVFRRYVSGNRIALSSDWIDACVSTGRALLEGDQYGGYRLQLHDAMPGPEHRYEGIVSFVPLVDMWSLTRI
ncbi:hypothetical protein PENSPDRAFT_645354 [Peniophora sp. CONT]|nr:hypothetical protein PENSPDRAFT_645354 [Peniophora sp. CONT]